MNKPGAQQPVQRRTLFWRLLYRSVSVRRSQAGLALVSLLVGATLAATLLNLSSDVRRKMTEEFRSYGANVILAPAAGTGGTTALALIDDDVVSRLASQRDITSEVAIAPLLHVVMRLRRVPADARLPDFLNVVAVGTDFEELRGLYPGWRFEGRAVPAETGECIVGARVADRLYAPAGDTIQLESANAANGAGAAPSRTFKVVGVVSTGSSEDDQVFVPLGALQRLAGLEGKLSLVELRIPGEPAEIERVMTELDRSLPGVEARAVRAIVESQGRVVRTVRWLLLSLTALILMIVALCVIATMTAIVLERKRDIAVMKALGATDRLVIRLLMSEGAGLGLLGGLIGFALGLLAARLLGRQLFDVALHPAWWTLPLVCLMTVFLAVAATAFPARISRKIEPATVLKGE